MMDAAETFSQRAAGLDPPMLRLLIASAVNDALPPDRRAILVGGGAVELYTRGAYQTGDVDLIGDRTAASEVLHELGFESEGRLFVHPGLGAVVEVPGSTLRDSEEVVEAIVHGYRVLVVRPEDVIVDRLLAATNWDSATDWEQALLVYEAQRDSIDAEALAAKARANDVEDALEELLTAAGAS